MFEVKTGGLRRVETALKPRTWRSDEKGKHNLVKWRRFSASRRSSLETGDKNKLGKKHVKLQMSGTFTLLLFSVKKKIDKCIKRVKSHSETGFFRNSAV